MILQTLSSEWLRAYVEMTSEDYATEFDATKLKRLSDENLMTAVEMYQSDIVNGNRLSAFIEYMDFYYNYGKTYADFARDYLGTFQNTYAFVVCALGLTVPSWIIIDEEFTLINAKKRYLIIGNHYFTKENYETT